MCRKSMANVISYGLFGFLERILGSLLYGAGVGLIWDLVQGKDHGI